MHYPRQSFAISLGNNLYGQKIDCQRKATNVMHRWLLLFAIIAGFFSYGQPFRPGQCRPPKWNPRDPKAAWMSYGKLTRGPHGTYQTVPEPYLMLRSCNHGLAPPSISKCGHNGRWNPPSAELNCDPLAYAAKPNDTLQSICDRRGGVYVESRKKCVIIPYQTGVSPNIFKRCEDMARAFRLESVQARPLVVDSQEIYDLLRNNLTQVKNRPDKATVARRSRVFGYTSYGYNAFMHVQPNYGPPVPVNAERWFVNGERICAGGVCKGREPFTIKGPGDHREPLAWTAAISWNTFRHFLHDPAYSTNGAYYQREPYLAVQKEAISMNMVNWRVWFKKCSRLRWPTNTKNGRCWNAFKDSHMHHPVVCEVLVWPDKCQLNADTSVVLMNGETPSATLQADEQISVKCRDGNQVLIATDSDGNATTADTLQIKCHHLLLGLKLSHHNVTCVADNKNAALCDVLSESCRMREKVAPTAESVCEIDDNAQCPNASALAESVVERYCKKECEVFRHTMPPKGPTNDEGCPSTVPFGCVSPFTYNRVTYSDGCTAVENNGVCWCSTTSKWDKGWLNCTLAK